MQFAHRCVLYIYLCLSLSVHVSKLAVLIQNPCAAEQGLKPPATLSPQSQLGAVRNCEEQ